MDELGPSFGGEGPRAEGGRGKVNLPPIRVLTRPTDGSADFHGFWEPFWHLFSDVFGDRFCIDFSLIL